MFYKSLPYFSAKLVTFVACSANPPADWDYWGVHDVELFVVVMLALQGHGTGSCEVCIAPWPWPLANLHCVEE